ncbi:tubulin-specific chaperone-like protein E [Phyllosticta citribraziliensis]|uniref:Tubulin-specific chaperone-like protein E n=1 Tax=Phyllosticta citribraziliensis TaxID=989973 RepID=A0ABR1LL20_9PEZI
MDAQFYPGKRLSFNNDLCTVHFVGAIEGVKGDWLGVEWDDPTRGKHDGSHNGVRYFECARKFSTAGSFVRPNRPSDPPLSYVQALKKKYASDPADEVNLDIVVTGPVPAHVPVNERGKVIKISGKEAEEVGFDKIRKKLANLQELRIVLLDCLCIARPLPALLEQAAQGNTDVTAANLTDVKDVSPKIHELDLSRNLFEEWREIASICIQLDRLTQLRADGNRFRDITLDDTLSAAFCKVTSLSLEDTLLEWNQLVSICSGFPNLKTLTAASNALGRCDGALLPTTITEVVLEKNDFRTLADLKALTKLPHLKRLRLKNNSISDVGSQTLTASEPLVFSKSLDDVDLAYNSIDSWRLIDALPDVFPGLRSIRIAANPLYEKLHSADGKELSADDGYMLTMARLGGLEVMNFSKISSKERLNAETYYLSQIGIELSNAPETQEEAILGTHRRYRELCDEYGEPRVERQATERINPNSLAARLINFCFYPGDSVKAKLAGRGSEAEEFSVELPRSFTVYSMLGVVGKRLGLPPLKLKLYCETGDIAPAEGGLLGEGGEWDSEEEENEAEKGAVKREVEWVAGTKMVGTWVEGRETRVRVEIS